MATRKIVNKHINESSSTYVGVDGELFYDTVTNTLKISDGTTPGGTTLITDGGSAASITVVGDDSTGTTFNAGETIKIAGTQNVTTAVSGDTLTITGPDLTSFATASSTTTFTNKSGNISQWTNNSGYLTNSPLTVVGDDSTGTTLNTGETLKIAGAGGVTTAVSGDTLTITGANNLGSLSITGSSITSTDSSSININENLNVDGNLTAKGLDVLTPGNITLKSTNYGIDLLCNVPSYNVSVTGSILPTTSGFSLGNSTFHWDEVNAKSFTTYHGAGASGITIRQNTITSEASNANLELSASGTGKVIISTTLNVDTVESNNISSLDSTAIQINDSVNISGTLNAKTLIANTISSEDSTAIQINDGLRISGDLTFSNNTVQTTAYVAASGNWTVTSGTNTYSFTVPQDGTYTMWVKGNIANGIIIWNATVSVSNSNVAAIGYQYAWNYTGGGSPIALTAIPDQIKGSAGTISTDATYGGTTSNRFDFGISNSSGASQTVYYGYAKIS